MRFLLMYEWYGERVSGSAIYGNAVSTIGVSENMGESCGVINNFPKGNNVFALCFATAKLSVRIIAA